MTPYDVQIGTRLELEILDEYGKKPGVTYISQLLEYQGNNFIIISAPIFETRLVYIPIGTLIRLTFIHPQQGVLGFTASVKKRDIKGNIAVLIIEPVGDIEKIQRRLHFRLNIALSAHVWLDDAQMEEGRSFPATTKNISGSGLCIVTETDIPVNSNIIVELMLADDASITAVGTVLRKNVIEGRKGKKFELGLKFTKISQIDQETIVRFIFKQQQLQLKKKRETRE